MSPNPNPRKQPALELRVLGPMELFCEGASVVLPRSKKCRALLGYLAVNGRAHRRERLCSLLWDVADDPRGALRWTLSRLRSVLPREHNPFEADRERVGINTQAIRVDATELLRLRGNSLTQLPTTELESTAGLYLGEFLEGLELVDFLEFSAWTVAQREELRRTQAAVLGELVSRLSSEPSRVLPWARKLTQIDSFSVQAHENLLRLLCATGMIEEAEQRYSHAERQLRQVSAPEAEALKRAWTALRHSKVAQVPAPPVPLSTTPGQEQQPQPLPPAPSHLATPLDAAHTPFIGRAHLLQSLQELLRQAQASGRTQAVLLTSEPGGGKTRLLEQLEAMALNAGFDVLRARAFEVERGRPYGPWMDALGAASGELVTSAELGGRTQLFQELTSLVHAAATNGRGLVLCLDDIQWLDRDSVEVLHHVMRTYEGEAFIALLAARVGELGDNEAVTHVIRSLQRTRCLTEVELEPLCREDVSQLVRGQRQTDLDWIMRASAGNPLYALELARVGDRGQTGPPRTLVQLVRERVNHLSDAANDVLRWAAVLGHGFDASRLEALSELSQMDLVDALEALEAHALLRIDTTKSRERYTFSHDIVREAVYGELSHPRRRLMHRKVAHLLKERVEEPATAYEVARHASLAGEVELGVRACTAAAQYALRTCANADAEALARRGLHLATELDQVGRVSASLSLLHILYSARAPNRQEATDRVRALAEQALDLGLTKPARIGFQMLSYLRWESSSMADAHKNILQAERVSRTAEPDERSQALAHAARCLVLLERNLGQAEAFVMEASGVAERSGHSSAAVAFALAMIAAHRGECEAADSAFAEAQDLARASGERLAEFGAMEHRLMLAIDSEHLAEATELSTNLVELAGKLRPGAEVAIAGALGALTGVLTQTADEQTLRARIEHLRDADAKYELAFVLTRWALHTLVTDTPEEAAAIASDAIDVANAIGRASELVIGTAVAVNALRAQGQLEQAHTELQRIEQIVENDLSARAQAALRALREC